MGAVRAAWHTHETPSSSASPKILPWAEKPLHALPVSLLLHHQKLVPCSEGVRSKGRAEGDS